jgi:bifunctional DNA-binding transcriptional regulator/antitoxin component of YhaV-PrlF toxin-antitoxin module
MMDWREKTNAARGPSATRVSRNGQIVLSAPTRRAAGIEPGDLVVTVPLAAGTVVVEKVKGAGERGLRRQYEQAENPLRGVWGADPDSWLDEIRSRWGERESS